MTYQKRVYLLIAISTLFRLLFTTTTELSADEAYYWTYALKLQWNYFDHPPLVAWLIRLTTANLLFHSELFVRLGAVICCAISTWLIFKLGTLINNAQTGWFAALLYTSSIYCSITAGANILPDSTQMVFWLASIILLIKISRSTDNIPRSNLLWCLFGLMSGLCIMSKVHGIFLWVGALLYILLVNRSWLKHRGVYLSAIITLIIISPIIIWNIQNDFVSYRYHSNRVNPIGSGVNLFSFFKAILEEATGNNPINFFLICSNLLLAFKGKLPIDKKELKILLFSSLPLIIVILIISFFKETYAHWSGPAFSCLLILPGIKFASVSQNKKHNIPGVIKWSLAYMIMLALSQILIINHFPGTLSIQKQGPKTGAQDLTLDMYGWEKAAEKFDSLYRSDISKKIMPANAPIIITDWANAAAIEFYIANKTKQEVIGIGDILDLHQYYWTNKYKKQLQDGDSAYFIVPSEGFYYRTSNEVNKNFKQFDMPLVITQYRGGLVCRYISIYRMKGYMKHSK